MSPVAQRWETEGEEARERAIEAATVAVTRGELVVLPTDTVYGVGCDAFDPEAVSDLLLAKGRGREMPPPVLIGSATTFDALASDVPDFARALAEAFWPGPLTLVARQQSSLRWDLGQTRGTVAVRVPDHEITRGVLERTGPLAVSSANVTGSAPATSADEAEAMLGEKVAVILDAGPSPGSVASTILDVTGPAPRLLREGVIPVAELDEAIAHLDLRVEV